MITELELKNFTVFKELNIKLSPKLNVIIGENGTGKTHLLKTAFLLSSGKNILENVASKNTKEAEKKITSKLLRLFMPLDDRLFRLRHRGTTEDTHLTASFASDQKASLSFTSRSKTVSLHKETNFEPYQSKPVFIPTKEVLTWVKGIHSKEADRDTVNSLFDDTYLDLCSQLFKSDGEDENHRLDFDPRFGSVFPALVKAIGGKYKFADGEICFQHGEYIKGRAKEQHKYGDKTKTVFRSVKDGDLSNNMTAEGFRKIGIIQHLLLNKELIPGTSGPLFWDEPEANMNPTLMKLLVETLLDLSRNGQQIILATHDYVLLKWFDLLKDDGKEDHIRFHTLYRNSDSSKVQLDSTDAYSLINKNAISDTFAELYDEDVKRALG